METKHKSIGHETADANVRAIVYTGIGLATFAVLAGLLVYGMFHYLADRALTATPVNPMAEPDRQTFPPVPRIEEHPSIEVNDLRSQEDRLLSTYGWSDKDTAVVRIPIERAIQLQLERGFPVRKEVTAK